MTKAVTVLAGFLALATLSACAVEAPSPAKTGALPPVHLPPDASGSAYRALLAETPSQIGPLEATDVVSQLREAGARNLDWLDKINATRSPDRKLRLTGPDNRVGYPISAPKTYSPGILETEFAKLRPELPPQVWDVVFARTRPTSTPLEIDDASFVLISRRIDRLYQTAARWTLTLPHRGSYIHARKNDVRGYYFLVREADLEAKLDNFSALSPDDQARLSTWLRGLCFNGATATESACQSSLSSALRQNAVRAYFERHRAGGESAFNRLYRIQNPRREMRWTSNGPSESATLPFRDPQNDPIRDFLKLNIEDEWKWGDWKLQLEFLASAPVRVEFEPGVVPHVNGLGGNTITMDANAPIEEYEVQWTIRHEFGHVLGFPDCYVEFYDEENAQMTSYQIDTADLMCSRAGNLLEKHAQEMKRAYGTR